MKAGKLTAGLALLTIGVLALADSLDIWHPRDLWRYWPLILIAIGLASEVEALQKRKSEHGFILIAIGVWMLFGTQHWYGLSIGTAFPIAIIVAGLGVLLHALVDRPVQKEKENAS
ncbi:MAG TPA: DUF5668 domain-containing protein [Thermoanaerobaculia bacterium]|nr:DUF5668 domain-containing protein [Thermoanaerobaculia bacterium]